MNALQLARLAAQLAEYRNEYREWARRDCLLTRDEQARKEFVGKAIPVLQEQYRKGLARKQG